MKSPITLNWPGVVALGLVLLAFAAIEIFGEPGTVTTIVELVLLGVAAGGAVMPLPYKRNRDRDTKPAKTIIPPPLLMLTFLALGLLASGCGGGVTEAAAGARTVRDVGCRGGRLMCRWADRGCRLAGGPWVVPRSAEEIATDGAAGSPAASPTVEPVVDVEAAPSSEAAATP